VRKRLLWALGLAAFCFIAQNVEAARSEDAGGMLRVCLNENLLPYSVRRGDSGTGFDLMIAEAVAKRIERALVVQWFETKLDTDSRFAIEANALLSDGRCDLLGGYPLIKDALGSPELQSGKLPDFAGMKANDRRRQVKLGALAPTRPYHFAPLTVVLGPKAASRRISSLADLDGVNVGIEIGTLGDAILMSYGHGRFVPNIKHVVPGRGELLPRLESGDYDATLIALHRFDAYKIDHPDTKLQPSGYYFPIGFNMGFVGRTDEASLIARTNAALDDMLKDGDPASLAAAAHMTYVPPRLPYVFEGISISDLANLVVEQKR
jgi:ABC-type amino acid transport substrate-binding protein